MAEKLKIISLGGLGEIGKNMTVLEYGNDILVIDCGLGFPDNDMFGVDLVIPDVSYLIKNQHKLRAIALTHGHEDHIGALPYILQQINAPIHATRLTAGLVELKLEEHKLLDSTEIITHEAGDCFQAGCFRVELIHVNHSIDDAVAFAVHTPVGVIIFSGDFKIDTTPIHGEMFDLARMGELGKKGVLAFLCDSTNVERPGFSPSERLVADSFDSRFKGCDRRIIVTTFASNVHRIQSILDVAYRYGRKVAVTGRSMENLLKVSTELGYMQLPPDTVIDINQIKSYPPEKLCIVTTGSQGETMSALYRMAFSGHRQVEIGPSDLVLISASAIPGNEKAITNIVNELYRKGAEVIYDKTADLHVSGHACQEELKLLHALLKPKFFIPVHGEERHLRIHARLAGEMGMNPQDVFISSIGQVLELSSKECKFNGTVPAGQVLVDGLGVGDVGSVVLRDRRHLAEDGMIVVVVALSEQDELIVSGPDIITRGFVYVKESSDLLEELQSLVEEVLEDYLNRRQHDWAAVKGAIKNELSSYLYKTTKRNPMILPVIMEV